MESTLFHDELARVAKALGHPLRVRVLDILTQGERSVDELCRRVEAPTSTVSSQLKVLREAQLVTTRREGTTIFYSVADPSVLALLLALRSVAEHRSAAVRQVVADYLAEVDDLTAVTADEATRLVRRDEVTMIDVRPRDEFEAGHIPGAISMPLDTLRSRAIDLPRDATIVAYCRDAYCVLAPEAVRTLSELGFETNRLDVGFTEWATEHDVARGA